MSTLTRHTFGGRALDRYIYEFEIPEPGAGDDPGGAAVEEFDDLGSDDDLAGDFDAEPISAPAIVGEPTPPPQIGPTQREWEAAVAFVERRVAEEMAPFEEQLRLQHENVVDPASGLTGAQELARAELEFNTWLHTFPVELRPHAQEIAQEHLNRVAGTYGADRVAAQAAMAQAAADVTSTVTAVTAFNEMADTAARRFGVELDYGRALADAQAKYAQLERDQPDNGLNAGLAVVSAVLAQDTRDRELQLSDVWGLAASLVERFEQPPPEPSQQDYRDGSTVASRFFGPRGILSRGAS